MKKPHIEHNSLRLRMEPLAIIGIGCMFPQADNPQQFWTNIRTGIDAITEVPESHWRPEDYFDPDPKVADKVYAKLGGFLSPVQFHPMDYGILPNALEAIDTSQLLGLLTVDQALKDAGYAGEKAYDRERVSVILGVTGTLELVIPLGARLGHPRWQQALKEAGVADDVAADVMQRIAESYVPWQENSFPGLLGNVVAGRISKHFDFGGTNCVVDAACASSLSALNLAALELASGRSDMVIAGGVDTFNDIFMYTCFSKTPALSPTGHAKPYSDDADGTTLGEGLGIVVLKRLSDALRDGDRIYAQIKGIGSSSDGRGAAIYEPDVDGQCLALQRAYEQAQVTPDTIELIEGHGTGTRVGDAVEVAALHRVFGTADKPWCALGSIKSQIGHTKAAAGAAGLIKAALALHHRILPPTIKVKQPAASLQTATTPFYVNSEARPWFPAGDYPRRAGVSALGFGGSNFHCLLEESPAHKQQLDWPAEVQIVPFSGADGRALLQQLESLPQAGDWSVLRAFAARQRHNFDSAATCRLVLVIEDGVTDRAAQLAHARGLLSAGENAAAFQETPDGVYFAQQSHIPKIAFLYPGQGAQYPQMLKQLALHFPEFLQSVAAADAAFSEEASTPRKTLTDLIYPRPLSHQEQASAALRATEVAQPALGAVSIGATEVLKRFGVFPDACGGHSYGELVALSVAGVLPQDHLYRLSRLRGELMASGHSDRGTMLAVSAPLRDISAFLEDEKLDLVLANRNTPQQGVLSGERNSIEQAHKILQSRGISCTPLSVSAAFHSPLVADAARPFAQRLKHVDCGLAKIPVYSNTTGQRYPQDTEQIKQLLAKQLAEPVDFVKEIQSMRNAGVDLFVEVGPGARLSGMVKTILDGEDVQTVALDASNGKRTAVHDLARLLAKVAALGGDLTWTAWDQDFIPDSETKPDGKKKLTVTLTGANYFKKPHARPSRKPAHPPTSTPATGPAADATHGTDMHQHTPENDLPSAQQQPSSHNNVSEALRLTQQNIEALQNLQQQTARLHQQFLEGQQTATQSFMSLIEQQRHMFVPGATTTQPGLSTAAQAVAVTAAPNQPAPVIPSAPPITAPAAPIPAPQPSPGADSSEVTTALLEVIAEKTGYPVEMLELSMSLDSDLGIDSIKRVEILSALQERLPELPAVRPEDLGVLQTLGQIVEHLQQGSSPQQPSAAAATATAADSSEVTTALLEVIAEKTGYPVEMLELGMSLDSDLGIDSIKRVEILSALQERLPELPAVRPEDLGVLQTLGQIVEHLQQGSSHQQPSAAAATAPAADSSEVTTALLEVIAEKTGYPVEMLELSMSLDSDLGIDSIKRVEILSALQEKLPTAPAIKPEHLGTLQTIAQIVDFLASVSGSERSEKTEPMISNPPPATVVRQELTLVSVPKQRPRKEFNFKAGTEVWLTDDGSPLVAALCSALTDCRLIPRRISLADLDSLTLPQQLSGLLIIAPLKGTDDDFINNSFRLLQLTAPALLDSAQSNGAFLATVSRLNGCFGLKSRNGFNDPLSGGLSGLSKTAAREWPTLHCKAVDLAMGMEVIPTANQVIEEIFKTSPMEIGISSTGLNTLELVERPVASEAIDIPLQSGDLVVISGGARGVTAAVSIALAQHAQPTLALLGRSPLPQEEADWLRSLKDETALKKALLKRSASSLSPRQLQQQVDAIIAAREIRKTMDFILKAGATPLYSSVDLRDAAAVKELLRELQQQHGPVRGLIHGAGVLADKLITDKTPEQFSEVYSTKVLGCRNLLAAVDHEQLQFLVMFSSSTGRFGRVGQVDYAVANEILNKMAQHHALAQPDCHVLSLNWGPWDGGMVTPALKKVFLREGIDVIDLQAGADYLLRELSSQQSPSVELVITGGTLDSTAVQESETHHNLYLSNAFDLDLDIDQFPFLKSHVIDGKAVLPVAMMVEWLAHAAIHNHPGMKFQGLNDLRVLKGVILEAGQSRNLQAMTGKAIKSDGLHVVPVELSSTDGQGRQVAHVRARVVLAGSYSEPKAVMDQLDLPAYPHADTMIYHPSRLFHGEAFQGIHRVVGCSADAISGRVHPAPAPQQWIKQPLRNSWFADPLALDSSFQLLILWSFEHYRAGSLPVFIDRYRQYQERFPASGVEVRVRIIEKNDNRATADIDFYDPLQKVLVARLEKYECVIDASLNATFQRNKLTGAA